MRPRHICIGVAGGIHELAVPGLRPTSLGLVRLSTASYTDAVKLHRDDLFSDTKLLGGAFTAAHAERIDMWLRNVVVEVGIPDGVSLVAMGGYGRSELAPESDLDIALVHEPDADVSGFAERVWYPIWDAGLKLGHRVDTVDGLLKIARTDLDTATALLSVRHLAGDEALSLRLAVSASEQWRSEPAKNAALLSERVDQMHRQHGEVAFGLGPDLKSGRGGLRDVQALEWARATGVLASEADSISLDDAYEMLLRVRVELHRLTGRPADRLVLEMQDDVAVALGYRNADPMMADIARAARTIAWVSDAAWFWVDRTANPSRRETDIERHPNGIVIESGLLSLSSEADLDDPMLILDVAHAAASQDCFIDQSSLERLASGSARFPDPWPEPLQRRFTSVLLLGRSAISSLEALDQVGLMSRMMPEWEPNRSRPQRNEYHRFTVDRHLLEAAAEASALTDRVGRADLLVLGALLHDIGKGYPGDHTEVGVELIDTIAGRMGYSDRDRHLLVEMCRHHLLLPDVATRRDLDDDGTIALVAGAVVDIELLELLGALTEADSTATGPSAWNLSKAKLVETLVERVRNVLEGATPEDVVGEGFPGAIERALMATAVEKHDGFRVDLAGTTITVVQNDRPGAFSRVAGVLTLNGLDIVSAAAHTEDGVALSQFVVQEDTYDTARLASQMKLGTAGRLALEARVAERRQTYARAMKRTSAQAVAPTVTFDHHASQYATVVEVNSRDQVGLLYRIAQAMSGMGIEISTARIQTIGDSIIDAFYVTYGGDKVLDAQHLAELERAILFAIEKK